MKKIKQTPRDFWGTINWPLYTLWESHKEEKEGDGEDKLLEKIMAKTS